jgi:eukaryotic-like serine/threonine-protein kinase
MQLRSPHALTVYDSGKDETGQLYYVMEFMPQTLKEFLQERSPLPVEHAVAIVGQICDALGEAHNPSR